MKYKIVEKGNKNAVHSVGYYDKQKAQDRIDSGDCLKYWINKEAEFIVVEDVSDRDFMKSHFIIGGIKK